MRRICNTCGRTVDGTGDLITCPECVAAGRSTTIRPRVCRACGATFPGGPRAWYCPECRRERKAQQSRECRERQRNGTAREIGSVDICRICGQEYTVTGGLQRYCPNCAPDAVRAVDREQSKSWTAEHRRERKEECHAAAAPVPCPICGRLYVPRHKAGTCSPECRRELRRQTQARADAKRSPRGRKTKEEEEK